MRFAAELIPAAKQVIIKTGSIFLSCPILDDQEFPEASKESGLTFQAQAGRTCRKPFA